MKETRMGKRKRKRVSKEDVRKNAKRGGGGSNWFNLPDGVDDWKPEKAGRYLIDIVPYETTDDNHPDDIEPGTIWYKRSFVIHHGVGPNNDSVVCPVSVGQKCPLHEERARLSKKNKDGEHDEAIKELKGQTYVAMNILDPEDSDSIALFLMSQGKFWSADAGLKKELEDPGDEDCLTFYDTEGGKTLKVRFSDETFAGHKFLRCSRIDFKDREDMDEDEILGKTVNLDKFLNVLPYEKLKKMFLQLDDDEEDDEKPKAKKRKKKKKKEPEPEEEEKPKKKKGKVKVKGKGKKLPKAKEKKAKDKKGKNKCPGDGTFGKDLDKLDECDDCPIWDDCEEANAKKKKKKK